MKKGIETLIDIMNITIDEILYAIWNFEDQYLNDIRFSSYFLDELEKKFNDINSKLDVVNVQLVYAKPTIELEKLKELLESRYQSLYNVFDKLSKNLLREENDSNCLIH